MKWWFNIWKPGYRKAKPFMIDSVVSTKKFGECKIISGAVNLELMDPKMKQKYGTWPSFDLAKRVCVTDTIENLQ